MRKYTKEEIDKAVEVDIVDYCNENGIDLIKDSEHYYKLAEHDSCVIHRQKNVFYWNSQNAGGNIINFIQKYEGIGFKEAMQKLLDEEKEYEKRSDIKYVAEPYEYDPTREVNSFEKAENYLVKERKIDPLIVRDLHDKGLLKQDKYNNVLFLWKEQENIMGCSEQGTIKSDKFKRGSWKSIQKNSTPNYGFNVTYGEPKNLKFFESSIDLLSYATLNKEKMENVQLVSMEGVKYNTAFNYIVKATERLKDAPDSIAICVDNDKAGRECAEIFTHYQVKKKDGSRYDITIDLPSEGVKDWNDQLKKECKMKESEKQKRMNYYRNMER